MPRGPKQLSYYSYDSLGNPWLSGGGAVRDFEILKRQRARWAGITYWTGRYPGFRAGDREGIRVRGLGWGRSYLISRITYTFCANLRLLWDRADAIGNSVSAYAPLLAGLLRPARFYLVAHHYVGGRSGEKYGLAGRVAWACEWLLMRGCRRLIVSNRAVAERVRGFNPGTQVLVTQNGFDDRLLDLPSAEAEIPYILFLGRFDIYMKGLDILIRAFAGLDPARRGRTHLILAGAASPKALQAVAELIPPGMASSIALEPNVNEERKHALLAACLFFCSPSRFEGWGIAALEANAAGKPALVSRADGFLDSIKDAYSGVMVPVEDEAALAAAMADLIWDAAKRQALGANAREWAKRFAWSRIAESEQVWLEANLFGPRTTSKPRA